MWWCFLPRLTSDYLQWCHLVPLHRLVHRYDNQQQHWALYENKIQDLTNKKICIWNAKTLGHTTSRLITPGAAAVRAPRLPTFLCDGAEFLLKFNVVTGTVYTVCQPGDRGLKVHQLGTQVGVGWVEADGRHAGRQRDLEEDNDHRGPGSITWEARRDPRPEPRARTLVW